MSHSKQPQADAFVASLLERFDIEPTKRSLGPAASEFQRVIDGKLYDSSKMEEVAYYETTNHEFGNYWSEEYLWRTVNGNWLLTGHGGSGTPWWDGLHDDSWGKGFVALRPEQAQRWMELRRYTELAIEFFKVEDA